MCGLAGFTTATPASVDSDVIVASMLQRIAYRGPDEQDTTRRGNVVLGHNRLSIMEPRGGRQPRVNEATGSALIYNGEIYNHGVFARGIQAAGGQLRDNCDTETLFWLLQQHGVEQTLRLVDGMFAFAWYDAERDELTLARDRFGQKPLFYSVVAGQLVFASELKALLAHPGLANVAADPDALMLYLMMEYLPGSATGLDGVYELPAGHMLTWDGARPEIRAWWQPGQVTRHATGEESQAVTALQDLLSRSVQEQLVADVPVGVFLSGGLDSSLVAALARRHKSDVATFTVSFPFATFDESRHAEALASAIGTRHTTVALTQQNCVDGFERLLANLDQPFADSSFLPSMLLCEATRDFVTVALGGDGADELFLGYPNFRVLRAAPLMALLPGFAGSALRGVARLFSGSDGYMNRSFLLRQLSYGFGKRQELQSIYWMAALPPLSQKSLWRDHDASEARFASILQGQVARAGDLSLLGGCQRHFIQAYLAHDILTKMDRASMYASLEVRSPFLSNAVSDMALSLPFDLLLRGGQGKYILRRAARDYLPEETISRKKHGFALPVSALLRSDLRDVAGSILLDSANAMYGLIDHDVVRTLWKQHVDSGRDNGKSLWALVMLAAFFRNLSSQ